MSLDEEFAMIIKELTDEWPGLSDSAKSARIGCLSIIIGHNKVSNNLVGLHAKSDKNQIENLKELLGTALSKIKVLETRIFQLESDANEARIANESKMLELKQQMKEHQLQQKQIERDFESMKLRISTLELTRDPFSKLSHISYC
jgi:chromosome segregation ATPase